METHKENVRADAFLAHLRRLAPDLRAEKTHGEYAVVASYVAEDDSRIFSFCVDGLLLDPDREARYVPYSEISMTSYYGFDELEAEKSGQMSRELTLTLSDNETIVLPLREKDDRYSERLRIGGLIEQRVRLARAR
ncbi:MAG: hypothetical protein MK171_14210 [Pirellulales bacterium]|nr:hypothetical protein [Pirellulales bacterium]